MARKFFGTDGIRGRANAGVLTAATAMKVGQAAGCHFLRGDHRHRVVIGKDTRLSGYMMETALVAGFTSVGMDVIMTGPLPTPAIALLTREMRAAVYLAKGGDVEGPEVEDRLVRPGWDDRVWSSPRITTRHTHGTGCTLSSAIATLLGKGLPLEQAIEGARRFVRAALEAAPGFGAGHGPMGHQAVR